MLCFVNIVLICGVSNLCIVFGFLSILSFMLVFLNVCFIILVL